MARDACISCGSEALKPLSGGRFGDPPLRDFIDTDPWGENPLVHLEDERWAFVECSSCSQRFHRLILSAEWNEIRFSRWMSADALREFGALHGERNNAADHAQHVLRLQHLLGQPRVLDFGCGNGRFLEMCRLFSLEAVGVDRSAARREMAGLTVAHELDEVPGEFDAITLFEVLEHLDDPLGMLRVLAGRLKSGGILVLEVPDCTGVTDIRTREDYYKIHPLDHINAFTPQTLVQMAKRAGLEVIRRPVALMTTNGVRAAKQVAREHLRTRTTQRYFRKS